VGCEPPPRSCRRRRLGPPRSGSFLGLHGIAGTRSKGREKKNLRVDDDLACRGQLGTNEIRSASRPHLRSRTSAGLRRSRSDRHPGLSNDNRASTWISPHSDAGRGECAAPGPSREGLGPEMSRLQTRVPTVRARRGLGFPPILLDPAPPWNPLPSRGLAESGLDSFGRWPAAGCRARALAPFCWDWPGDWLGAIEAGLVVPRGARRRNKLFGTLAKLGAASQAATAPTKSPTKKTDPGGRAATSPSARLHASHPSAPPAATPLDEGLETDSELGGAEPRGSGKLGPEEQGTRGGSRDDGTGAVRVSVSGLQSGNAATSPGRGYRSRRLRAGRKENGAVAFVDRGRREDYWRALEFPRPTRSSRRDPRRTEGTLRLHLGIPPGGEKRTSWTSVFATSEL